METFRSDTKDTDFRWRWVALLLLCVAGFLRIWNLDTASFWVDEVNTVFAADSYVKTGQMTLPSGSIYGRAPVHTHVVSLFYRFFGVSETTSRMPSAVFGILSIVVVYFLARRVFDGRTALLSVFLMTFSHFEVGWSRVTRMYTLLQFLSLCIAWCFLKGMEQERRWIPSSDPKKSSFLSRVREFFARWNVSPLWLLAGLFFAGVSTLQVHLLTLFLGAGLWCYVTFRAGVILVADRGPRRFFNKYAVMSVLAVLGVAAVWVSLPSLRETTQYFLAYTPPWAVGPSTAQRRMYLFEFLISYQRFPLAAFFFVGCVQIVTRRRRQGWLFLWVFFSPLFLLTFLFTHRVPTYLFFVYPFFLMIAAFGFVNIVRCEIAGNEPARRNRWVKRGVVALFCLVFLVSPWLRITLHIPFLEDGITNMAVTPDEWREASRIVEERQEGDDAILTSLPQVALYYGLHSDYGLNWAQFHQAVDKEHRNETGEWCDVYAGVPCVVSLDHLRNILRANERVWVLVSRFHLEHSVVIPEEVRLFLQSTLGDPSQTKNGTVLIYCWSEKGG